MERRFFMNDFEQSLKEHADNFQMVPSKKVWHGIYNDLHPGKRWPSVTMSLLLIFTLVVIGHLNTNNSRRLAYLANNKSPGAEQQVTSGVKKAGSSTNTFRIVVRKSDMNKSREAFVNLNGQSNTTSTAEEPAGDNQSNNLPGDGQLADNLKPGNNSGSSFVEKNLILIPQPHPASNEANVARNTDNTKESLLQTSIDLKEKNTVDLKETLHGKITNHPNNAALDELLNDKKTTANNKELAAGTEASPANKDADKKSATKTNTEAKTPEKKVAKLHKKRNEKISWVYFAAPVVSTVSFSGEPLKETQTGSYSPSLVINPKQNKILHNSALGIEAGAQLNYALTPKLKLTTGVHLTYSGYNIVSNEVHPFHATLVLRDPGTGAIYSRSFITHYGDGTGQTVAMIRNYNWQVSIPVGMQYEVLGNDKVQFNLGGNIEPSLVLKSRAYILAAGGNNYVNDPSLIRKLNLNSNFGAFVTFSSSKFKWQIGPNIRYQWLSTYLRDYTVKEHLIDYGIRIGISR